VVVEVRDLVLSAIEPKSTVAVQGAMRKRSRCLVCEATNASPEAWMLRLRGVSPVEAQDVGNLRARYNELWASACGRIARRLVSRVWVAVFDPLTLGVYAVNFISVY
jgi:hypothetical protein